ncbi:hypothetical protein [Acinetobacter larvae]|nr:hypothetical protein [Acinetobacter larvae]
MNGGPDDKEDTEERKRITAVKADYTSASAISLANFMHRLMA